MSDAREWRDWLALSLQQQPAGPPDGMGWQPLLPVSARQLYCRGDLEHLPELAYLLRSRARRWLARTAWHAARFGLAWPHGAVLMARGEADLLQQVLPADSGASPVLIQFGSPGPFQKVVVLSVSPAGRAWVSKVAFRPGADELLAGEASWLARLGQIAELKAYVPELARAGCLTSGRRFLTMPAASVLPSPAQLGPRHRRFLEHLCRASSSEWLWDEAPLRQRLHGRFLRLSESVASPLLAGPLEAWQRIDSELRGRVIPTCIGHGDFAPWNINRDAGAITVFDWEYAQDSATPLHDFFHFHCIQRVLVRRSRLRPRPLMALLQAGRSHLQAVLPAVDASLAQVAQMFRLYLLDTLSMYVEASGGVDARDQVVADCADCLGTLRLLHEPLAERAAGVIRDNGRWPLRRAANGDATVSIRPR
ncbi:MAG: hypothetical protein HT579_13175 [Candidatus Accumulibacter similis]|nr:MAG: hypothetical protein HT579_13175 [Candidatus Accumulibacter similis]